MLGWVSSSCLYCCLALRFWQIHLPSLSVTDLICKTGAIRPFCQKKKKDLSVSHASLRTIVTVKDPKGLPVTNTSLIYSALDPLWSTQIRVSDGNPLQYSCLENHMDRGAWWATVQGVAKSWTRPYHWAHTQEYLMHISWVVLQMLKLPSNGRS